MADPPSAARSDPAARQAAEAASIDDEDDLNPDVRPTVAPAVAIQLASDSHAIQPLLRPPALDPEAIACVTVVAILEELRATEEAFVGDLRTMVNTYLLPMRERRVADPRELISLFSNAESLLKAHQALFSLLPPVRRLHSSSNLGADSETEIERLTNRLQSTVVAFISLEPFLSIHAEFAANYEETALGAHRSLEQQPAFSRFCRDAEKAGALPLQALLIRPIQRCVGAFEPRRRTHTHAHTQ